MDGNEDEISVFLDLELHKGAGFTEVLEVGEEDILLGGNASAFLVT